MFAARSFQQFLCRYLLDFNTVLSALQHFAVSSIIIIIIIIIIILHLYSALKSCKGYGGAEWHSGTVGWV